MIHLEETFQSLAIFAAGGGQMSFLAIASKTIPDLHLKVPMYVRLCLCFSIKSDLRIPG